MNEVVIGLMWHTFGHGNLGVDALARGDAEIIRAAARERNIPVRFISVGTAKPEHVADLPSDVTVGGAAHTKDFLRGRSEFVDDLRKCDIVFDIGEGDSFTDIYGARRFLTLAVSKQIVRYLRKPLVIAPQTIGPFEKPLNRRIAAYVMNSAEAVYARDNLSTAQLQQLNLRVPTDEFIDVAFRLPFDRQSKAQDKVRVGLNVSGLLYNKGYSGDNELGMTLDYGTFSDRLIAELSARDNVELHFVAHVAGSGDNDDDWPTAVRLADASPGSVLAPRFENSVQAKSYISGLDFFVGGRMHACIGAFSSGVPVVPVAYSRKFNGLFGSLGYTNYVDGKAEGVDIALAKTLGWFDQREQLAAQIQDALPIAQERLSRYQTAIGDLLSRYVAGQLR
ncbi:polysaccharide pyruvyl transferase family protein [Devosia oryziradicis]|uniref:Polysaccharide pyruvyl transferase family protein n=1 Tax=Devosia oryziradicis TaxID=2801335 RepID=A0ABX7BTZ3_9HYPH|nr:polysaccharide pyruvyl transferase family protein [Devosia oryziradicis]QQR35435.1 polysaccharide pyruvyl transferase family protein [Devosia oryziradicis]